MKAPRTDPPKNTRAPRTAPPRRFRCAAGRLGSGLNWIALALLALALFGSFFRHH